MIENLKKRPKYKAIAKLVEKRIYHGDYNLKPIPSERELAQENGVASGTARLALRHLVDLGVLEPKDNGRLSIAKTVEQGNTKMQIAFLATAFPSNDVANWQLAIDRASADYSVNIRPVYYVHPNDPVIQDTIDGFDAVFLIPELDVTERIIKICQNAKCPLVVVGGDWSRFGIPSVCTTVPEFSYQMLDYLKNLGHERIDCLNVNLWSTQIPQQRIKAWQRWLEVHRCEGELINDPVQPFEWGIERARVAIKEKIESGKLKSTAIFCTGEHAAVGSMRAAVECGLEVGRDISVCEINNEGLAKYLNPTLTSFEIIDASPYLSVCLDWMSRGGGEWIGPLLVKPTNPVMFKGESTGAAPERD